MHLRRAGSSRLGAAAMGRVAEGPRHERAALAREIRMRSDSVEVPAGQEVVVMGAAVQPFLVRARSGVWILNLGASADAEPALEAVEGFVAQEIRASVFWFVQREFLAAYSRSQPTQERVRDIVAAAAGRIGHCAVVPCGFEDRAALESLVASGFGVHFAHEDGACLVEVHRPEGITIGMPGPPFVSR